MMRVRLKKGELADPSGLLQQLSPKDKEGDARAGN